MEVEREFRDREKGLVSMLEIKDGARRMLPVASMARSTILAEKDTLPVSEAMAKLEIFDRLLQSELGHDSSMRTTTLPSGS
jgi:hypothetical protein